MRSLVTLVSIFALTTHAVAQAPAVLPVQAYLTDGDGNPIDGDVAVRFSLYDDAGSRTAVFSELQTIRVADGFFDAYLGDVESLDLAIFDAGGAAHLGITVEGDAEMVPRISLGTVPFAAYAENAATLDGRTAEQIGVPSGAVMMFATSSCPTGWAPFNAARGRAVVGSTGTGVGSTVGSPLSDREDRAHTHIVDPLALSTTTNGAHTHTVDPAPVRTRGTSGLTPFLDYGGGTQVAHRSHDHEVDIPATTTSSSGSHSHVVNIPPTTSTAARTSDVIPYVQLLFCQKS